MRVQPDDEHRPIGVNRALKRTVACMVARAEHYQARSRAGIDQREITA